MLLDELAPIYNSERLRTDPDRAAKKKDLVLEYRDKIALVEHPEDHWDLLRIRRFCNNWRNNPIQRARQLQIADPEPTDESEPRDVTPAPAPAPVPAPAPEPVPSPEPEEPIQIGGNNIPLGGFNVEGVSLLSLILALICAISFLVMLFGAIRKTTSHVVAKVLRLIAIVTGVVTVIAWIVLDQLQMPNVWIDEHTPIIIVLFAVFALSTIVFNITKLSKSSGEQDQGEAYV
jgi:hypothetical protein